LKTHYIVCKDCGVDIAQWGGGMNWQKKEEWVCQGRIEVDCSKDNVFMGKDGTKSRVFTMDGGAGTQVKTPPDNIRLNKEMRHCSVINNTTYCEGCARKYDFKCPICGGGIKRERKER